MSERKNVSAAWLRSLRYPWPSELSTREAAGWNAAFEYIATAIRAEFDTLPATPAASDLPWDYVPIPDPAASGDVETVHLARLAEDALKGECHCQCFGCRTTHEQEYRVPITVAAYTPAVAPGPYQATCTGVEEKATKDGNTFRVWEFTLDDGRTTSGASSLSTSPKSKGGKWLAALLGTQPEAGAVVEPVGRRCTIIVELDDNGYERVTTVAPAESKGAKSPVKPLITLTQDDTTTTGLGDDPNTGLPF